MSFIGTLRPIGRIEPAPRPACLDRRRYLSSANQDGHAQACNPAEFSQVPADLGGVGIHRSDDAEAPSRDRGSDHPLPQGTQTNV